MFSVTFDPHSPARLESQTRKLCAALALCSLNKQSLRFCDLKSGADVWPTRPKEDRQVFRTLASSQQATVEVDHCDQVKDRIWLGEKIRPCQYIRSHLMKDVHGLSLVATRRVLLQ